MEPSVSRTHTDCCLSHDSNFSPPYSATEEEQKARIEEVAKAIQETAYWEPTYDELDFGCRTAWRNAVRCIGRIQWSKLKVNADNGFFVENLP